MDTQTIERHLNLADADLLELIGDELVQRQAFAMEPTKEQKQVEAASWLEINRALLQKQICNSTVVTQYLRNPKTSERVALIGAIADLILGLFQQVAAVSVAIMIFREGLQAFCPAVK